MAFGHLDCIGIPAGGREEMAASVVRAAGLAEPTELPGGGRLLAWADASGARLTLVANAQGSIECLTPSFVTDARLAVATGGFGPSDCPYETPLFVEVVGADEEMCYPMAVQVDDLAVSRPAFAEPGPRQLHVAAFTEQWQLFDSEAEYRASGTPMAVESLIPSGLFDPGVLNREAGENAPFEASPRILMSGVIEDRQQLVNAAFGLPFVRLRVRSLCHTFDVLAPGALDQLGAATIVSGTFWVSGRLA